MNEVWLLFVKTSLPHVCRSSGELSVETKVFDSFEKGRDAMRAAVKKLAFSKNSMFDGKGNITKLKEYAMSLEGDVYDDDFDILDSRAISYVMESLQKAFSGEDVDFEMPSPYCTDWMIAIESQPGEVAFHGEDDGPCNGYDPDIRTNMFSMKEEKNYYLYIDDLLGQDEYSSELYVDLIKAKVE